MEMTRQVLSPTGESSDLPSTCNPNHKGIHYVNESGSRGAGCRVCICEGFVLPKVGDYPPHVRSSEVGSPLHPVTTEPSLPVFSSAKP